METEKGIAILKELLQDMPGTFQRREAVLWDKRKQNLLYVFEVPGDPRKGKLVVEVDVIRRANRGDKMENVRLNFVTSGSLVPKRNPMDGNLYDPIEGKL